MPKVVTQAAASAAADLFVELAEGLEPSSSKRLGIKLMGAKKRPRIGRGLLAPIGPGDFAAGPAWEA